MLKALRNSALLNTLWGLLILHLINISVDSPDRLPKHIAEDLSFNDQESIIEMVLEQVIGIEDAIPEHDEADDETQNKRAGGQLTFVNPTAFYLTPNQVPFFPTSEKRLLLDANLFNQTFLSIPSPPPKA